MNNKNDELKRSCIDCTATSCDAKSDNYPNFCPTPDLDPDFIKETMKLYIEDEENAKLTQNAALVEHENYCKMTRIEEIVELSKKMGYKKIGIATCVGLIREARSAATIFRSHGFEVFGVGCKIGAQKKHMAGIDKKCEGVGENMCNPILQAKMLNKEKTDFNVLIGLCVGHDSLFYKYSEALCTTLIAKDRVLGHNPVAALYQTNSYYSKLVKK